MHIEWTQLIVATSGLVLSSRNNRSQANLIETLLYSEIL